MCDERRWRTKAKTIETELKQRNRRRREPKEQREIQDYGENDIEYQARVREPMFYDNLVDNE